MKKKLEKRTIKLYNRIKQNYSINLKGPIAETRNCKRIFVNDNFFKLTNKEQIATVYHERGHLKKNNCLFFCLSNIFLIIFGLSAAYPITNYILNYFGMPIISKISLTGLENLLIIASSLIIALAFRWTNEIICDFNAVKNVGKEEFVKSLKRVYLLREKNISLIKRATTLFEKFILYPPPGLRIGLIEEFD